MSESQEINETLEVVKELPETVELSDGKTVTIYKCKVQHLGTVLKFLTFILEEMEIDGQIGIEGLNLKSPSVLLQMFSKAAPQMIEVVSVLCSLDQEEVQDLELDDAVEVAVAIWNLNQLFFSRQVLPKLPFLQIVEDENIQEQAETETQTAESRPQDKPQEIDKGTKERKRVRQKHS